MQSIIPTALAQTTHVNATAFGNVVNPIVSNIVNPAVKLMFAIAVVVFVYGVLQMVIRGEDEDARKKGRNSILYGVIGMFIMIAAWGIINLVATTVTEVAR